MVHGYERLQILNQPSVTWFGSMSRKSWNEWTGSTHEEKVDG